MTQDEIWMQKYEGVKAFILRNGRNPSVSTQLLFKHSNK